MRTLAAQGLLASEQPGLDFPATSRAARVPLKGGECN